MRVALISLAAIGMVAAAGEAKAERAALGAGTTALSDHELDRIRGAAPLLNPSSTEVVRMIVDSQTRLEFRGTAEIANIVFDNWFNDVGSLLIANNLPVR